MGGAPSPISHGRKLRAKWQCDSSEPHRRVQAGQDSGSLTPRPRTFPSPGCLEEAELGWATALLKSPSDLQKPHCSERKVWRVEVGIHGGVSGVVVGGTAGFESQPTTAQLVTPARHSTRWCSVFPPGREGAQVLTSWSWSRHHSFPSWALPVPLALNPIQRATVHKQLVFALQICTASPLLRLSPWLSEGHFPEHIKPEFFIPTFPTCSSCQANSAVTHSVTQTPDSSDSLFSSTPHIWASKHASGSTSRITLHASSCCPLPCSLSKPHLHLSPHRPPAASPLPQPEGAF